MAYSTDVPDDYNIKFVLPYKHDEEIDDRLINATDEIIDIQNKYIYNNNDRMIRKPTVRYNPLFSPADLIDHAIHVERYKEPITTITTSDKNTKEETNKFDPYLNYLKEKGLINDSSELRYKVEYINIDSANRKKEPYNNFDNNFEVSSKNLKMKNNKFIIKINPDIFYVNQKISIEGIQPLNKQYYHKENIGLLIFTANSSYVQINVNANLTYPLLLYPAIDTTKLFVTIANIEGNDLSSYIGNIPISLLNKIHQIYLVSDTDTTGNINRFYIKLPFNSDGTQATTTFYLSLTFLHYNCIPLNELNANYPINEEHVNGYQIISSITDTEIEFLTYPPINSLSLSQYDVSYNNFVDSVVYLNTVISIVKGYPNSHSYTIQLPKAYSNIVQVNMISSIFPNVFKAFKGFPSAQQNNKLYFQDIDNGDNIQYVELEEGTYTDEEFIKRMEYKFSLLTRSIDITNSVYDSNYYVKINIEKSRDYIEFRNYRRALLTKPIVGVTPAINVNDTTIGVGSYIITINHPNHKITNVGTEITLLGFIEHLGLTSDILNKTYVITNILDDNTYQIQINRINLQINKTISSGGYSCQILVPRQMRLFFTYSDSMGEQIGFRKIGDPNSITNYSTVITNKEPYENEITFDVLKNRKVFTNTSLTFFRDQYIIITCKELVSIKNTIQPIDIFAKINLTNNNAESMIDSIICPPIFYYNPIQRLSTLSFEFYTPDGKQFDFNNIDHSFVLEFTMMDNIPENTGLLSNNSNAR